MPTESDGPKLIFGRGWTTPAVASSGVMGRSPLSFNDGDAAAETLVASYIKDMFGLATEGPGVKVSGTINIKA